MNWNWHRQANRSHPCYYTLRGCMSWNKTFYFSSSENKDYTLRGYMSWNHDNRIERLKYFCHCTLLGCMSWNCKVLWKVQTVWVIASYVGVWIKTKHNLNICASPLLHPMWVYELKPAYTEKHSNYKADCTLRGCMSWNCDYWTDYPWCTLHPTWVYELKRGSRCSTSSLIAPYVGVWVEISVVIEYKQSSAYYALRGCVSWNVRLYQWKPYI